MIVAERPLPYKLRRSAPLPTVPELWNEVAEQYAIRRGEPTLAPRYKAIFRQSGYASYRSASTVVKEFSRKRYVTGMFCEDLVQALVVFGVLYPNKPTK